MYKHILYPKQLERDMDNQEILLLLVNPDYKEEDISLSLTIKDINTETE